MTIGSKADLYQNSESFSYLSLTLAPHLVCKMSWFSRRKVTRLSDGGVSLLSSVRVFLSDDIAHNDVKLGSDKLNSSLKFNKL